MSAKLWCFDALDTLFFRDGRPFNAGESAWLDSQFPPAGFSIQGAIRTAILTNLGADFKKFAAGEPCLPDGGSLKDTIGDARGIGKLSLTGPFVLKDKNLFFPSPLDLVKTQAFAMLTPSKDPIQTDLGPVRLPTADGDGLKTQEGKYTDSASMEKLLAGNTNGISLFPLFSRPETSDDLAFREPKIGLARDNETRKAQDGMLYAIAPVRMNAGVAVGVVVDGLDDGKLLPQRPFCVRLGGEGKLAAVDVLGPPTMPVIPQLHEKDGRVRFKLVLTTPALFETGAWLPDGFHAEKIAGTTVWKGSVGGFSFDIVSACVGKPVKIGGFDMANRAPRPLEGYVPAGSVYFCEAPASSSSTVGKLNDQKIGKNTQYGFGHVLVGTW